MRRTYEVTDKLFYELLAKYQHQGCPGQQMEDICANPAICAGLGCCQIILEEVEKEDK
jgi:hypothetical protein